MREWEIKKQRNKNTNRTCLIRKSHPTASFFNFCSRRSRSVSRSTTRSARTSRRRLYPARSTTSWARRSSMR
ncbi:hypothetical protein K438DRAFT_489342 [Mycena galopus ATCC 62051]|nr:hypothetical protein K438DRAFT_489342 [Mycena galopus ATCC 62051]